MQWAETTPPRPKSKGRFEPPGVWASKSSWWASRMWSGGNSSSTTITAIFPSRSFTPASASPWRTAPRKRRPHQARQLHARRLAAGARRRRAGIRVGGQYRRRHGDRQDGAGRRARRGPSCAGRRLSHHREGLAGRGGGCRRERGLLAAHAGAVRRDGRDLLAHHSRHVPSRASACSRSARRTTRATR